MSKVSSPYVKQLTTLACLLILFASPVTGQFSHVDSLLFKAVTENDLPSVKECVEAGANVNLRDAKSATVFHYAAIKADLKMLKYLITVRTKYNATVPTNRTDETDSSLFAGILLIAAAESKLDILKYLIEDLKIDINGREVNPGIKDTSATALCYAAYYQSIPSLKYLISKGADLSAKMDTVNNTSLYYALRDKHYEVAKILIENGADIFLVNKRGDAPSKNLIQEKQPLISYESIIKNINIQKNKTDNIYSVYLFCVRYFDAIEDPVQLSNFIAQYVDTCKISERATPKQFVFYLALMESSYEAEGRYWTLVEMYRNLQKTSPFRDLPVHRDFLKSTELDKLSKLGLYREIYTVAHEYFTTEFSGHWNFYSMKSLISFILGNKRRRTNDRLADSLLVNLIEFAQVDSTARLLTEANSWKLANLLFSGNNTESKEMILAKLNIIKKIAGTLMDRGIVNTDSLLAIPNMPIAGVNEFLFASKLYLQSAMGSKDDFNRSLRQFFDSIAVSPKANRRIKLNVLQYFSTISKSDTGFLKSIYNQEIKDTSWQSWSAMENFLLIDISEKLHEKFSENRAEWIVNRILNGLDTVALADSDEINLLLQVAYKAQKHLTKKNLRLNKYFFKLSDHLGLAEQCTLSITALLSELQESNTDLYEHTFNLLHLYIEKKLIAGLGQNEVNIDAGLSILQNYNYTHNLNYERLAYILLSAKNIIITSETKLTKSQNAATRNLYTEYRKIRAIYDKNGAPEAKVVYEKMDKIIRSRLENETKQSAGADENRSFLMGIANRTAFINFYSYTKVDPHGEPGESMYGCYIYSKQATAPIRLPLFEERQLTALLGDSAIYEIKDKRKQNLLFTLIWKPIEVYLKDVDKIYLSPARRLNNVPFDVIRSFNKDAPARESKIVYLTLINTRDVFKEDTVNIDRLTAFGGIDYKGNTGAGVAKMSKDPRLKNVRSLTSRGNEQNRWPDLYGALEEVTYLKRLTKGSALTYMGSDATELAFHKAMDNGPSPEILHIATHGYYYQPVNKDEISVTGGLVNYRFLINNESIQESPNELVRCGLIFASNKSATKANELYEDQEDGTLTGQEITRLDLSNTQLVVLSACSSAKGDTYNTSNLYGLVSAFKLAGVKYVVASMWELSDEATTKFMSLFYTQIKNRKSITAAFQSAQKGFKLMYPDPYFWGAFILVK